MGIRSPWPISAIQFDHSGHYWNTFMYTTDIDAPWPISAFKVIIDHSGLSTPNTACAERNFNGGRDYSEIVVLMLTSG
jgi:hypothetical protein